MSTITEDARFSRQSQLIAPRLRDANVLIGGVGMLGSFTALALARCTHEVIVFDPDVVEDVNTGNQAYNGSQVGVAKAEALESLAYGLPLSGKRSIFPIEEEPTALLQDASRPLIVVSGADSFRVRGDLANYARHHGAEVFVDTRAMGELCIVCIVPQHLIPRYLDEEMRRDDEVPDVPCGYNGTSYCGMYVAARVTAGLNAYFGGRRVPFFRVEDLSTGDVLRCDYDEATKEVRP